MEIVNNDVFRSEYKELTDLEKKNVENIKKTAQDLHDMIEGAAHSTNGRYISLSKTALEESIMWVVKGITS